MSTPSGDLGATGAHNVLNFFKHHSNGNASSEGWSSLIGVVTAICGNILISFALNTQRYAHMRLAQDRDEREEKRRDERRRRRKDVRYGATQSDIADKRAKDNAQAVASRDGLEDGLESSETDALIPSVETLDSRKLSTDSGDTAREDEKDEASLKEKSYLKSGIWWLGIVMMTIGEAGNFLAYGFAPASIVSPLGVVALISNCLIAPLLLHERFRWRDGIGVIIAVAGCVTVVISASDSNPKLTPNAIWHLITRWEFETYFGITCVLILALSVASNKFGEKTILIDIGLVGLYGGYTALSTKGVASLLSNTIWRAITFPITYLLVAVLVFTAVMQIKYVNRALQRFSSTMVIPTQFVMFTISVIMGSAILYRDFERTTTQDAITFIGGCALTFLGVWCITSGRSNDAEGDEEVGEQEEGIDLVDEEGVQPEIREREDNAESRQALIAGSSKGGPFQLRHKAEATPVVDITPSSPPLPESPPPPVITESPIRNTVSGVMPANTAAIHSDTTSIIPHEPEERLRGLKQPPPMHATTSAPTVPTTNSVRPRTPLKRGISNPADESPTKQSTPAAISTPLSRRPSTPAQHLDPQSSHKILNRHSVVGLLPGPLTSPLSSSLSAIVADSLRRGVDHTPIASLRRRSLKMRRRPASGVDPARRTPTAPKRHSIASGEMDLDEDPVLGDEDQPARPRSFSTTIGDIFGSSSKRRRMESTESVGQQPRGQGESGGS